MTCPVFHAFRAEPGFFQGFRIRRMFGSLIAVNSILPHKGARILSSWGE